MARHTIPPTEAFAGCTFFAETYINYAGITCYVMEDGRILGMNEVVRDAARGMYRLFGPGCVIVVDSRV